VRLGNIRKIILPPDRVQNHTEHEVFITDSMLAVFNTIPRVKSKDGWYFTTNGKNPSSGFSRAKKRLDSAVLAIARAEAENAGKTLVRSISTLGAFTTYAAPEPRGCAALALIPT
jgi:hypothetical protein